MSHKLAMNSPIDRFRADVEALTGAADHRLGLAVSGGPDSMAMLWLASRAFPGRIEAATVDHRLRPESADEAAMVADWCADAGVPHATLCPADPITGNLQSAARHVRYQLLRSWQAERALDYVLTAHHADDQLETVVMRLNRGSGVGGLAGIRDRSGRTIRPLLAWRRADLARIAIAEGLPHVTDPSNADPRFDRAALRAHLADADWLDPAAAVRSAAALADADAALDWTVWQLLSDRAQREEEGWSLDLDDLPREIVRRIILSLLEEAGEARPRGDSLDHALAAADSGGQASLGGWLLSGGDFWLLRPAPPRRQG